MKSYPSFLASVSALLIAGLLLAPGSVVAEPATSSPAGIGTLVSLGEFPAGKGGAVLLYREKTKVLELYKQKGEALSKIASASALGHVWNAAPFEHQGKSFAAVAFGYGRGALSDPLRVVLFDTSLKNPKEIYKEQSPRSQTTHIRDAGGKLLITYFDSKYFTRTGYITPGAAEQWGFEELFRDRLAMYWATSGKTFIVGRPYRNPEDDSLELRRRDGNGWQELPSFRGVSALALVDLDDDDSEEILIADGWHKNYGELAQARLSLVDCRKANSRCDLRHIDTTEGQVRIEKIAPVVADGLKLVVTRGETHVDAFFPNDNWRRERIYTKQTPEPETMIDFAVLEATGNKATIVIYDGKLVLKTVSF